MHTPNDISIMHTVSGTAGSICDKREPRWKRRKDARPKEVIDAALLLFSEFGYSQTRLDDVAAKAGISKGTVYLYFASKQELFEAVIKDRITPWLEALAAQEINREAATDEVIRDFLSWGWNQFLETKLFMITKVVLAESNNFPDLAKTYMREVMGPVHDHMAMLLARGVARGEVEGDVTPERVKALLAPLSWLSMWRQVLLDYGTPPVDESRFVREAIHMVCRSIAPHRD